MERDDEVSGSGNSYTAPFWQYSSRLAHRWNLDPKPVTSISSYAVFQGNPIMYSDPFGDSVSYNSVGDRLRVGMARLNKGFNNEFKTLKNSEDNFTFDRNSTKTSGITKNGEGNFAVNYRFGKDIGADRKAPVGKSAFHDLFEETFHAADYLSGNSGMDVDSESGSLYFTSESAQTHGESKAWNFAAKNAPFFKRGGYGKTNKGKLSFGETLITRIRNADDNLDVVKDLITKPQLFNGTKVIEGGYIEYPVTTDPLY